MNELLDFLEKHGFNGFDPILDGTIQRFDREGSNTGWFCGTHFTDVDFIKANVGDWKTGEKFTFLTSKEFSNAEKEIVQGKIKEFDSKREKEKKAAEETAQKMAQSKWASSSKEVWSPYLTKKGIEKNKEIDLRTTKSSWDSIDLLVPCWDIEGVLWGVQKIQDDGSKFFQPGQRIEGCFYQFGKLSSDAKKIFLCEGIATGCSIYLSSKVTTFSCFNASNLSKVAEILRKKYPLLPIIICGDDDRFTLIRGEPYNTGRIEAEKAAAICQGVAIYPGFKDLTSRGTDFNDLHTSESLEVLKDQLNSVSPPNPKEIIKTQNAGFHMQTSKNGKVTFTPCYEDLRRYFEKIHAYKLLGGSGLCYVYNGKRYKEFEKAYLNSFSQTHFNPLANNNKRLEFRGLVEATNLVEMDWFEETTMLKTNFQNGILDNETMEFFPHSPNYGFRYVLNYNYDAKALCPNFDKFLDDVTKCDEGLKCNLLEFAGYALSNDSLWIHKALVLEGQGSNGKSTFMTVLRELAGKDNCSAFTLSDLKEEGNRQCLDGKLFNMTEETPSRSLSESSIFKNLVGGGVVNARQLYKNPYSFKNRAKIIFACNEMPETSDTSHGYLRRLMIIPFRAEFSNSIGNKDPHIEQKLLKELPGIFNKVLRAYKEVKKRGDFTPSESRDEVIASYRRDIDNTLGWVEHNLIAHAMGNGMDAKFSPISKIYLEYRNEMETQGLRADHAVKFGKKLSRFIKDYKDRVSWKRLDGKMERVLIATTRESGENF